MWHGGATDLHDAGRSRGVLPHSASRAQGSPKKMIRFKGVPVTLWPPPTDAHGQASDGPSHKTSLVFNSRPRLTCPDWLFCTGTPVTHSGLPELVLGRRPRDQGAPDPTEPNRARPPTLTPRPKRLSLGQGLQESAWTFTLSLPLT